MHFLILAQSLLIARAAVILSKKPVANIFEALGYSPMYVASALASCECSITSKCPILPIEIANYISAMKDMNCSATYTFPKASNYLGENLNNDNEIHEFSVKGVEGFSLMKSLLQVSKNPTAKENMESVEESLREIKYKIDKISKRITLSLEEMKMVQQVSSSNLTFFLTIINLNIQNLSETITNSFADMSKTFSGSLTEIKNSVQKLSSSFLEPKQDVITMLTEISKENMKSHEGCSKLITDFITYQKSLPTGNDSLTEVKKMLYDNSRSIIDFLGDVKINYLEPQIEIRQLKSLSETLIKNISLISEKSIEPITVSPLDDRKLLSDLKAEILEKLVKYLGQINDSARQESSKSTNDALSVQTSLIIKLQNMTDSLVTKIKEIKVKSFNNDTPLNTTTVDTCAEFQKLPNNSTGVWTITPNGKVMDVYCDLTTDGGGWTVIQNRDALPVREVFYRAWNDYVTGFGDLTGEFWLGLENIHALTSSAQMELRVDLEDFDGAKKWAKYESFKIGDSSTKYALALGNYSGDAGDSLSYHNGMKFTTYDQDNDNDKTNCALSYEGAWWYNACFQSNLNGFQHVENHSTYGEGIIWNSFHDPYYSLKKTSMKVRPKS